MNNSLENNGGSSAADTAGGAAPGGQTPLEQPWFKEAYKAAMQFYEKDEVLDSEDRLALSDAYRAIARSQMIGGWLGFSAVFIPPFTYKFYKTKDMKGVKVPRNFVLALVALFGTTIIAGNIGYNNQLKRLDPDGSFARAQLAEQSSDDFEPDVQSPLGSGSPQLKTPAQRQFEMMSLLKNGSATKWASYFYITEKQPEKRLPNPAIKLKEIQQVGLRRSSYMNQRDPIGLYEDIPEKDRYKMAEPAKMKHDLESDKTVAADTSLQPTNSWANIPKATGATSTAGTTSWDKIRQLELNPVKSTTSNDDPFELFPEDTSSTSSDTTNKPMLIENSVSQSEFQKLLDKERSGRD